MIFNNLYKLLSYISFAIRINLQSYAKSYCHEGKDKCDKHKKSGQLEA